MARYYREQCPAWRVLFPWDPEYRWGSLCVHPCPRSTVAPGGGGGGCPPSGSALMVVGVDHVGPLSCGLMVPGHLQGHPSTLVHLLFGKPHRAGGGNF